MTTMCRRGQDSEVTASRQQQLSCVDLLTIKRWSRILKVTFYILFDIKAIIFSLLCSLIQESMHFFNKSIDPGQDWIFWLNSLRSKNCLKVSWANFLNSSIFNSLSDPLSSTSSVCFQYGRHTLHSLKLLQVSLPLHISGISIVFCFLIHVLMHISKISIDAGQERISLLKSLRSNCLKIFFANFLNSSIFNSPIL